MMYFVKLILLTTLCMCIFRLIVLFIGALAFGIMTEKAVDDNKCVKLYLSLGNFMNVFKWFGAPWTILIDPIIGYACWEKYNNSGRDKDVDRIMEKAMEESGKN